MRTWRRTLPRSRVTSRHDRSMKSAMTRGELLALVLLQEVPATLDRRVRLPFGAGHVADELALAALGDRVAVAEGAEERLVERPQHLPRLRCSRRGRVVGRRRHQRREDAGAGHVGVVGERSVVGGDDVVAQAGRRSRRRRSGRSGISAVLGEVLPREERLVRRPVAGRHPGVADDDAAKRSGSAATRRSPTRPPQSWPKNVMPRRSRRSNTTSLIQRRGAVVGVVGLLARLVGATEADEVGRDAAMAGVDEHRDHLPVEERPRRLAVHEQHRRPSAGPRRGSGPGCRRRSRRSAARTGSREATRTARRVCGGASRSYLLSVEQLREAAVRAATAFGARHAVLVAEELVGLERAQRVDGREQRRSVAVELGGEQRRAPGAHEGARSRGAARRRIGGGGQPVGRRGPPARRLRADAPGRPTNCSILVAGRRRRRRCRRRAAAGRVEVALDGGRGSGRRRRRSSGTASGVRSRPARRSRRCSGCTSPRRTARQGVEHGLAVLLPAQLPPVDLEGGVGGHGPTINY